MTTTVTEREADERRDALRLLLQHPLITADGRHAEGFALVRRHRDALARDVRQLFGYRLVVEAGFARLYKAGLGPDGARPLRRTSGSPFSPRAYAYLSLCCAVLLTGRQQVLLSWLVEEVRQAATEAGLGWSDDTLTARRDLAAALRHLVELGVLVEDDGTVSSLADDADCRGAVVRAPRARAPPARRTTARGRRRAGARRACQPAGLERRSPPPGETPAGRGTGRCRRRHRRRVVGLAAPVPAPGDDDPRRGHRSRPRDPGRRRDRHRPDRRADRSGVPSWRLARPGRPARAVRAGSRMPADPTRRADPLGARAGRRARGRSSTTCSPGTAHGGATTTSPSPTGSSPTSRTCSWRCDCCDAATAGSGCRPSPAATRRISSRHRPAARHQHWI